MKSIIICGVGHFARAMENFYNNDLIEVLNDKVIKQRRIVHSYVHIVYMLQYNNANCCVK